MTRVRHLRSSGQWAIAAAEAWEMVAHLPGKRAKNLAPVFGVNNAYVQHARALVESDPDAAEAEAEAERSLAFFAVSGWHATGSPSVPPAWLEPSRLERLAGRSGLTADEAARTS